MKKLFAIILTIVILLTTTACGGNNNQPTYAGNNTTGTTSTNDQAPQDPDANVDADVDVDTPDAPKEPTRGEASDLYYFNEKLDDLAECLENPIPDQDRLNQFYTYFQEATWADQWDGTEYATNIPRREVLANFHIVENVMLKETCVDTDALGNSDDPTTVIRWNYSLDGKVIDQPHTGKDNKRVSYTDMVYENPLCLDACPVYTYDETGRILSCNYLALESWRQGETIYVAQYNYNDAGQLTVVNITNTDGEVRDVTYTYDANGLLIEVKATSFNNKLSDSYIKYTYGYDDQGRLIYREMLDTDDYTNKSLYYKWVTEFTYEDGDLPVSADQTYCDAYYINTYTDHWDYEYDDQGRVATVQVTYGHEYNKNNGELIREHHNTSTITVVYGDYLIYTAN